MTNLHTQCGDILSLHCVCRFGVTEQAYFKDVEQSRLTRLSQEAFAVEFIHSIRKVDSGIGGMKLWYMYSKEFKGNAPLGLDRFETVVDKYGLKVRLKTRKPRTTNSRHGLPLYPNLIKRFIPTAPNQLWVGDITYVPIWIDDNDCQFCYLSLIMDAYSEIYKNHYTKCKFDKLSLSQYILYICA
ncbi:hypothetical protein [Proteiniphilum sp. UBA5384]|uniref:hypothetical protein n=1 Tax=Proteiniphilum sp. UBA5384 TaxID=1947279 RepID=UPI0025D07B70|nr:hypothetical protein [Proteiniphilum sp. UBA5384]